MSPLEVLVDALPPRARKAVYAGLLLAGVVFGAWQAADGDWAEFVAGILSALGFGLAVANTPTGDRGDVD